MAEKYGRSKGRRRDVKARGYDELLRVVGEQKREELLQETKRAQEIGKVVKHLGEDLVSEGTYESYENTVYLAGACNVGKTTLASVFLGKEIPMTWRSTDGLVIYFGQNGIDLVSRKMVPMEEDVNLFAKVLRGGPEVNQARFDENMIESRGAENPHFSRSESKVSATSSSSTLSKKSEAEQQFYKLTDEFLEGVKNGKYRTKIAPSDLVDFGGQESFDMTHQLFIRQNGAFVVMFDGRYGFSEALPKNPGKTNKDIVEHWVSSILTYCVDEKGKMPMILFAATHSDCFNKDEFEIKKGELLKTLNAYFGSRLLKNHIVLDTIFFINARDPDDKEITRLQSRLVEIAFDQPSWGTRRPVRWIPLEIQLAQLKTEQRLIVEKESLKKINNSNGDLSLSEEKLTEYLVFQHSVGKLMYFNQPELEEFVVLHPPALVNILKSFITDEIFWPKANKLHQFKSMLNCALLKNPSQHPQKKDISKVLKAMYKSGRVSKQDLFKIWKQKSVPIETPEIGEFVIKLLVHLDVLIVPRVYRGCDNGASANVSVFFVPCIIKEKFPVSYLEEEYFEKRTIALVFTLRTTIPSALAYKLIGAVASIWPLKEEGDKTLLFEFAAVLSVDLENDMRIAVQDNKIVTYLTNTKSNSRISQDVAASIQECLVNALNYALDFYNNSLGGEEKIFKASDLYDIEIGEVCQKQPCVVTVSNAMAKSEWICSHGKSHKTKLALNWVFERKTCDAGCRGVSEETLEKECDDLFLIRLAKQLGMGSFRNLMLHLHLVSTDLENLEFKYDKEPIVLYFMGFKKWRDDIAKPGSKPCIRTIKAALSEIGLKGNYLCQALRNDLLLKDEIACIELQRPPDDEILEALAFKMGHCTVHLGIELGLDIPSIESTLHRYQKDMFEQTRDILMKWKKGNHPTIYKLMEAVNRIDKGGLKFLMEKYRTGNDT